MLAILSAHLCPLFSLTPGLLTRTDLPALLYLYLVVWKLILLCSFPIALAVAGVTSALWGHDLWVRGHGITRDPEGFLFVTQTG